MYIYIYIKGVKNHFHEFFHKPGYSADSLCPEDIYFIMLRYSGKQLACKNISKKLDSLNVFFKIIH